MDEDVIGTLLEEAVVVGVAALATVTAAVGVVDYRERLRKERAAMECPDCPGR